LTQDVDPSETESSAESSVPGGGNDSKFSQYPSDNEDTGKYRLVLCHLPPIFFFSSPCFVDTFLDQEMESDHVPHVSPKCKKKRKTDDVDNPPQCCPDGAT
jgi:hypothetical protein